MTASDVHRAIDAVWRIESARVIAGYAIVQAKSKQEAIELAKRFLSVVGDGESEIRLMHEAPAFATA